MKQYSFSCCGVVETMWLTKLLSFVCLLKFSLGQGGGPPEEPKYVLVFDSDVYMCPGDETASFIDTSNLRAVRVDETSVILTGNFTFHKEAGPFFVIELILSKETNGHNSVLFTDEICDMCSETMPKDESTPYTNYLKFIEFPEECPIPAGIFNVKELKADLGDIEVKASNAGKYHVNINMYSSPEDKCQEKEFLGCVQIDLSIELEED